MVLNGRCRVAARSAGRSGDQPVMQSHWPRLCSSWPIPPRPRPPEYDSTRARRGSSASCTRAGSCQSGPPPRRASFQTVAVEFFMQLNLHVWSHGWSATPGRSQQFLTRRECIAFQPQAGGDAPRRRVRDNRTGGPPRPLRVRRTGCTSSAPADSAGTPASPLFTGFVGLPRFRSSTPCSLRILVAGLAPSSARSNGGSPGFRQCVPACSGAQTARSLERISRYRSAQWGIPRLSGRRRHSEVKKTSRLNTRPTASPVNASLCSSRNTTHD